ncbi:hypothetical protein F4803DRAFT_549467 [Xylaria telfairii]|nr:hypothetical protein F4803DRAFT_549467 [Xylaria telfairii]
MAAKTLASRQSDPTPRIPDTALCIADPSGENFRLSPPLLSFTRLPKFLSWFFVYTIVARDRTVVAQVGSPLPQSLSLSVTVTAAAAASVPVTVTVHAHYLFQLVGNVVLSPADRRPSSAGRFLFRLFGLTPPNNTRPRPTFPRAYAIPFRPTRHIRIAIPTLTITAAAARLPPHQHSLGGAEDGHSRSISDLISTHSRHPGFPWPRHPAPCFLVCR